MKDRRPDSKEPERLLTGATVSWYSLAATYTLIALNVLIFLYQSSLTQPQREIFILRWAVIPLEITENNDLQPTVPFPIAATLLTSLFLHGDLAHLSSNLFYLWVFSEPVERALGWLKHLLLYLLCGSGAALLHLAFNSTSLIPMLGASGAIAGLMAAHLVLRPGLTVRLLVFGVWLIWNLVSALGTLPLQQQETGGTAFWPHIGGLAVGTAVAFLFRRSAAATAPAGAPNQPNRQPASRRPW